MALSRLALSIIIKCIARVSVHLPEHPHPGMFVTCAVRNFDGTTSVSSAISDSCPSI